MLMTTTTMIDGKQIKEYKGIVTGEAILGANIFRDMFASIRDIVGGRSAAYERELATARKIALDEMAEQARQMGADAVVGIDLDYEVLGVNQGMLMVAASGTAASDEIPPRHRDSAWIRARRRRCCCTAQPPRGAAPLAPKSDYCAGNIIGQIMYIREDRCVNKRLLRRLGCCSVASLRGRSRTADRPCAHSSTRAAARGPANSPRPRRWAAACRGAGRAPS